MPPESLFLTGRWLHPCGEFMDGTIWIEDERIQAVQFQPADVYPTIALPPGCFILPGWIELQVNGGFGIDFRDRPEGIQELSSRLPAYGVTAFLPTIFTSPLESYPATLAAVSLDPHPNGAVPLGIHLEGPFLNPRRKGAHNPDWLCPPDPGLMDLLLQPDRVRLITFAPELSGGEAALERVREKGIIPAIGHSDASYSQARHYLPNLGYAVHLFNAMPPLHHREPGLVAALLEPTAPPVGLIADGVHVHPSMLRLAYAARGAAGLTLVSDASTLAGFAPGSYSEKGHTVIVDETSARLPDGTLAGSTIFLDTAVRNMVRLGVCSLEEAARMASRTPAEVLGLDHRKGQISPGFDADITVLDPNLQVVLTVVAGKIAYRRA